MIFRKKPPLVQNSEEEWRAQWQSIVSPEHRNVPITVDGATEIAYVQINQFVLMLQDGLLMQSAFFDVCDLFQRAGYHVIWLMRCTQDIHGGYLHRKGNNAWFWKSPTTNFGRWTSDNFGATILLQYRPLPEGNLRDCHEPILQRVTWAESDDATRMIPTRTRFQTVDNPATPAELLRWLQGASLHKLKSL